MFSALKACGTDALWFSSTTSCIYCKESAAARADPALYAAAPSALDYIRVCVPKCKTH
ncbi:MAG: hypothetical protein ACTTH7_03685 [Treponema sp.]